MSRKRRKGARLEMTSLMDVMFLVLVVFIYCIFDMVVHRGVKVDLPRAAGGEEKGERIVITILADDSMQLNGVSMPKESIVAKVAELNRMGVKFPIIVSGDRQSSLGVGVELLADLRNSGVEKASFQVDGRKR
jgi:biopolymer transport protein ExbD